MFFKKKVLDAKYEPVSGEVCSSKSSIEDSSLAQNTSQGTQQWTNSREFLLSCIAMSVGLGNVWRFPYIAYENGGGAFLIPYFVMLFLVGRPIYFMELILGQFSSMTTANVWKEITPVFRGIGLAHVITCFYILTYYFSLIAIATYYFLASFSEVLPWTQCDPDMNTTVEGIKQICKEEDDQNNTTIDQDTQSVNENMEKVRIISPAEQYFVHYVLKMKSDISDGIGTPDIRLLACLAFCYTFLFFSMCKGVQSSGKV